MGRGKWRRRAGGWAGALLIVSGLSAAAESAGAPPEVGAITQLLPRARDQAACFTTTPSAPVEMTLEDWSEGAVTFEAVPGLLEPSGKPATRPVPKRATRRVTDLVLSVAADDLNASEPYRFLLSATLAGGARKLRASGPCNLFDPVETGLRQGARGAVAALGCWVECDGGSIAVERAGGAARLSVTFGASGLRMTPGCSDETDAFHLKAPAKDITFSLAPADEKACRALRAWARNR